MEKQYYISKEQYQAVKAAWKIGRRIAWDHVIYNVLRDKPISTGFCENKSNPQGNDTWFALKQAISSARMVCNTKNPWEANKDKVGYGNSYQNAEDRIAKNKKEFKDSFGIDMPEDIMDRLKVD